MRQHKPDLTTQSVANDDVFCADFCPGRCYQSKRWCMFEKRFGRGTDMLHAKF